MRIWVLAIGGVLLAGACVEAPEWNLKPSGRISAPELVESSGLVASGNYPGILWSHNDDEPATLFAMTFSGDPVRTCHVQGARNNDWEDIAKDLEGNLYLYDNTSRFNSEHRSTLLVIPEPDPYGTEPVRLMRSVDVLFPDRGYDVEALFLWGGRGYFVTKPWDGSFPRLYRLDNVETGGTAEYLGEIPALAMVTGADISPQGDRIVLASYTALFVFEGSGSPEELLRRRPLTCSLNAGQIEGVTWLGEDLVLSNEARDLFFVPSSSWRRGIAPALKGARLKVPYLSAKPEARLPFEFWPRGRWLNARSDRRSVRIGRIAWSPAGLHIGIQVPTGLHLQSLEPQSSEGFVDWFIPGRLFLLVNPSGDRPPVYGPNDFCILVGYSPNRELLAQTRALGPATFVRSQMDAPPWVLVEESGARVLVTIRAATPGVGVIGEGSEIGFNVLLVGPGKELISWTPLIMTFSWDAPNRWGMLEMAR